MQVVDTIAALRAARRGLVGRVGLVATMGALHDGHLALVRAARIENDTVLATIFVNPTQFAAAEDLDHYPRDLPRDLDLFQRAGVDLVFTPNPDLMYPQGYQTYIEVEQVSQGLEGAQRPGHFRGVTTVVAKLFNLTQADRAYFGQKDAQQVVVIRQMARDLNVPLEIIVCPTVREADGLAMSSRNVYLTPDQRARAVVLYRALRAAADLYESGERHPQRLRDCIRSTLAAEPTAAIDYVSLANPHTLAEAREPAETPLLASAAIRLGTTRLLDNMLLPASLNDQAGLTATLGA